MNPHKPIYVACGNCAAARVATRVKLEPAKNRITGQRVWVGKCGTCGYTWADYDGPGQPEQQRLAAVPDPDPGQ